VDDEAGRLHDPRRECHYITETWTGCNKYKGLKALCTWTMRQADFQDATRQCVDPALTG